MDAFDTLHFSSKAIEYKRDNIMKTLLQQSPWINDMNFDKTGDGDLQLLFDLYDEKFFDGRFTPFVRSAGSGSDPALISFKYSGRMTKSAGLVKKIIHSPKSSNPIVEFQIKISYYLLFQSFAESLRPIRVAGKTCKNRLEALLLIMEHEIIHLIEIINHGSSKCSKENFRMLATKIFGHTDFRHQLLTTKELAQEKYKLSKGDRVKFTYDNKIFQGRIKRITKRATVMVKEKGTGRMLKFYIPLPLLEKI